MEKRIRQRFDESVSLARLTEERLVGRIAAAAGLLIEALRGGRAVYVFGNGGSAADAQHIACELVGRFLVDRPAYRVEALSADVATMTAIANDYDYEAVFARPLAGKARRGDVAVALSTSGNSPNVVAALAEARRIGCKTIALTGSGGGCCAELADVLLDVPGHLSPRVQEVHQIIYHVFCELVEEALAGDAS
jgi:D-sedoheptulose 7-phosphate isomerase